MYNLEDRITHRRFAKQVIDRHVCDQSVGMKFFFTEKIEQVKSRPDSCQTLKKALGTLAERWRIARVTRLVNISKILNPHQAVGFAVELNLDRSCNL